MTTAVASDPQLAVEDVAEIVGIKPASIYRYRARGTFPAPDGRLGKSPWWFESTVRRWLQDGRRRPGRPRKEGA